MITWRDIPDVWKFGVAIVMATIFVFTYHDQFVTEAEAMEQQRQTVDIVNLLRVERFEDKLERLIDEKADATERGDQAEHERLTEEIKTLRDKIERTCATIKDGCD